MRWIKNLKIKQKVLSAFLLVSLFISIVDFIGIKALQIIRDNGKSVYENNMVSIHQLDRLNENLLTIRSNILSVVDNNLDLDYSRGIFDEINYLDRVNKALMENYEATKFVPEEKKVYDNFKRQYSDYINKRDKIIKLIKNGDITKSKEEITNISKIRENMFDSLNALRDINMQEAMKNNLNNNNIYNRVAIIISLLAAAELITAIFLGIYISKYISNQLEKELKFAEDLADGNLTGFIEVDSKDEFGTLAEKLNKAAENTLNLVEELTCKEEELTQQMHELYLLNEKLMVSEERYRLAIEGANDGIWEVDINKKKAFISDRCKEIVDIYSKGNIYDLDYCLTMIFGKNKDNIMNKFKENFSNKVTFNSFQLPICTPMGEKKYVLTRSKVIWDSEGEPIHLAGSITDITDRKKDEKTIENMAYYNEITGLPNRTYTMKKLCKVVEDLSDSDKKFAVFFLDMDNFKTVNDTLGHATGDSFLKEVAKLFKTCLKKGDVACHLGGDEFVFLISSINSFNEINEIADTILNLFKEPLNINGHEIFYVTASMGIATGPNYGKDLETLLKNADTAMYYAKNTGRNKYEFFTNEMNSESMEKLKIKNDLRNALIKEEFTVFYQPKVSVRSGKIVGMEALIRWIRPEEGMISPAKFIPLAEETGLIVQIGEYVIREACLQNKAWQISGKKPLRIAVNLSIKQLQRKDIVQTITNILDETKLDPKWFEIEITESMVMENFSRAIGVLSELKDMGIHISLDDFGTGYSSLNYLRKLPINAIKIDKSFVDGLHADSKENFIAASLINLAHGIGMKVIAEGVENIEQANILKSYNCDEIQGYYFSKPVAGAEFEKILQKDAEL